MNRDLKTCIDCQTVYQPTGNGQKRCVLCIRANDLKLSRERTAARKPIECTKEIPLKICKGCLEQYTPTGYSQLLCKPCAKAKLKADAKYRLLTGSGRVGVGLGGANDKGKQDTQYSSGMSYFMKIRKIIKEEVRYCQRCSKDLVDATRHHWCVHHIDHDRTNNVRSNLMLLCKRCHQIEHECHKAFKCVTTRAEARSGLD